MYAQKPHTRHPQRPTNPAAPNQQPPKTPTAPEPTTLTPARSSARLLVHSGILAMPTEPDQTKAEHDQQHTNQQTLLDVAAGERQRRGRLR